jgi:hypothetical protein
MMTLDRPIALEPAAVLANVADLLDLTPATGPDRNGAVTAQFRDQSGLAALLAIDAPIPASDLVWPAETAVWWPDAARVLERHRAHLIASLFSEDDRLTAHLKLTRIVQALLDVVPATGVLWGSVVVSPDQFEHEIEGFHAEEHIPLRLWLNIHVTRDVSGASVVSTTGLSAFGLMEIECERLPLSADAAYAEVYDLALHLITHGPVIRDGDTIGTATHEKLRVRHTRSFRHGFGSVYRLECMGEAKPLPVPSRSEVRFRDRRPGVSPVAPAFGRRGASQRSLA